MIWVSFAARVLVALAMIVVGAAAVRPRAPRSGYLLIAAGAVELLASCCMRGTASIEALPPLVRALRDRIAFDFVGVAVALLVALALVQLRDDGTKR